MIFYMAPDFNYQNHTSFPLMERPDSEPRAQPEFSSKPRVKPGSADIFSIWIAVWVMETGCKKKQDK